MGNGEETILKLERIVKKYKTKASFFGPHGKDVLALNEVSLEISRGEIFGHTGLLAATGMQNHDGEEH